MVSYSTTILKFDEQGEKTGWTYIVIPSAIAQKLKPGNKKSFRVKGKLDTKCMALLSQKRLYPSFNPLATERSKKPHEGIIDALCISHYLKNHY